MNVKRNQVSLFIFFKKLIFQLNEDLDLFRWSFYKRFCLLFQKHHFVLNISMHFYIFFCCIYLSDADKLNWSFFFSKLKTVPRKVIFIPPPSTEWRSFWRFQYCAQIRSFSGKKERKTKEKKRTKQKVPSKYF